MTIWLTLLATTAGIHTGILLLLAMAEWLAPKPQKKGSPRAFSVIVAARNEAENLEVLLPALLEQQYFGTFEVIVALDRCTDRSLEVVKSFSLKWQSLKWIEIEKLPSGVAPKKYALTQAIESARYPWLAFTDADCLPGPLWLESLHQHFDEKTELIIGTSPYQKRSGLLNLFIRFETFVTAFLYTNLARVGFPYMAVGRNLAYRKSFFEKAGGFAGHLTRLSGDDDLLVNHHASSGHTAVMATRESMVESMPATSWKQWFRQKTRHLSASGNYSFWSKIVLTMLQGAHALFYVSLTCSLLMGISWSVAAIIYGVRMAFLFLFYLPAAAKWQDLWLLLFLPVGDLLMVVYHLTLLPAGLMLKPTWKTD
jgi:cellulose synthase/poly-beta-1,6-N-acetylglucosamine synthase-like glycosyltransferase